MKKIFFVSVFFQIIFCSSVFSAKNIFHFTNRNFVFAKDTIKERDRVSEMLRNLRNGSVIVRLKKNQKSVDAYRQAGKNDIAEKIEADRKKQNQKIYFAFKNNFKFCNVFFIYANETDSFLNGNFKLFLNSDLKHDTIILFTDTNFVFAEYGSAQAYSSFNDVDFSLEDIKDSKLNKTQPETSTAPASSSSLFFTDKNLRQLFRPFPAPEGIYLDNFDAAVRSLDREMERAYMQLVVKKDFKQKMKAEKKKQKELLQQK